MRVNPTTTGNIEHIQMWVDDLLSTTDPQVNALLAGVTDDGRIGYCCLGKGCDLMGLEREEGVTAQVHITGSKWIPEYRYHGMNTYPPREFHRWLGLEGADGDDVFIDWPDYPGRAYMMRDIDEYGVETGNGEVQLDMSCADLNDCGFTFAQIGQLIAYFGLRNNA